MEDPLLCGSEELIKDEFGLTGIIIYINKSSSFLLLFIIGFV